jgi:DNA-binding CsgD family transcriptional regulator
VTHADRRERPPDGGGTPLLDLSEAAALAAAIEEIPSPAFVVWADGRIACANRPGQAASGRAPELVATGLLESLRGSGQTFRLTPIVAPGAPSHFIAVQVGGTVDPAPRVAAAAASLGFTPRQAQVLALLALGRSNKGIANELGCAESTVEIHVTALLAKSGCESRCEFVSRFWSEPIGAPPHAAGPRGSSRAA